MFKSIRNCSDKLKLTAAQISAMVFGLAVAATSHAQAVTADPFTAAVTDVTTKTGTYAAALVGVSAVSVIFMVAMKYVKKLPRAA